MFTVQLFGNEFGEAENAELISDETLTFRYSGFAPYPYFEKAIVAVMDDEGEGCEYDPQVNTLIEINIITGYVSVYDSEEIESVELTTIPWDKLFTVR
jgi:hypothetical protein